MRRYRLSSLFIPAFLLLSLLALGVFGSVAAWHFRAAAETRTARALEAQALLLAELSAGRLEASPREPAAVALDRLCKDLGQRSGVRLTVVRADGTVLADAEEDPLLMANHRDRPEIAAALAGGVGRARRYSATQHQTLSYVAVPVAGEPGRGAAGAARAAVAVTEVTSALRSFEARLLLAWAGLAAVAALAGSLLQRRLGRRLAALQAGAERFARGELADRLPAAGPLEIAALAEAMNRMAASLDERIRATLRQSNEQEAVLFSMMEGVLAVDDDERILKLNEAAAHLLRLDRDQVQGRHLQEVVRNVELHRFLARVLQARAPQEGELVLRDDVRGDGERFMQVHGTVLRDESGHAIGALVVLNDVTRLRRLETVRREFVANVSHELKTPITSIKGFVETLLDGAYRNPDEALGFLGIVAKQADRLNAIIEDLLMLSRLEQEAREDKPALAVTPVRKPLQAAVQACEVPARERGVTVDLSCPENLAAPMNAALVEQAAINLIDNAVKFSEAGGRVRVEAARDGEGVAIRVRDEGCGISREHLPRLFERFYRVDKGRSRKQGGTGLGLAIVKHIVKVHGGTVGVESAPGEGSVFTIRLPG